MIDPNDPRQARKYEVSGYMFLGSMIFLVIMIVALFSYIYINKLY